MDPLSILVPDSHTDLGNGRRLIRAHGPDLRYVHPWKKWLVWDGRKWREDNTAEADRRCKAVADGLYIEARKLVHDIDRAVFDRALGFARFSSSSTAIHRMQTCASSEPGVPILPEQLDAQHWLLSCSNGIVDLRTGQLRPHDRGDLLTKSSPVAFDPAATCPTWERFILQIVASEAVARFLQRLCGYWATGIVRDQILPIFYGSGANGKTTFLNAVMSVIGADFCMKAPTTAAASPGRAVSAL